MARLVRVPLGCSARERFVRELEQLPYGEGVLVLPNRLLLDDVRLSSRVEVMGLDTLANKLLNLNGYVDFKEISRRSQELIVQDLITYMVGKKNLQQLDSKELSYFNKLVDKEGFVKAMTSLIGQLARSGVAKQEIVNAFSHWERSGALQEKDKGVLDIYLLYRQYLENNQWFDLEGKYRLALRVLSRRQPKLGWKKVYFCDFYSFDKLQLKFIKKLAQHCEVTLGLTYEQTNAAMSERERIFNASKATYEYFSPVKQVIKQVEQAEPAQVVYSAAAEQELEDARVDFQEEVWTETTLKQQALPEDISQLRQLGINGQAQVAAQHVHTYKFNSREKEMRWVLTSVKRKLQAGVQPTRILVAVRDLNTYSGLRLLADEYGIPVNLPKTTTLAVQPLAELVRLLCQAASDTHEGALAYLRLLTSELLPLLVDADIEAVDRLRQDTYFQTRLAAQQAVQAKLTAKDTLLEQIDGFIAELAQRNSLSGYCEQLAELLHQLPLEQHLGSLYKQGRLELKALVACLKARDAYLKLLEQLKEDYVRCARADEPISLSEWQDLLAEAAKAVQLVLEPGRADGVLITSVVNVQGLSFHYVYLLGVREGEFPKVDNENWIYNDKEREELAAMGVELPRTVQAYAEDAWFFAVTLTAAQKELYLTWFEEENVGASAYIDAVQKLFSNLKAKTAPELGAASAAELERLGAECDEEWLQARLSEETLAAAKAYELRCEQLQPAYNGVLQSAKAIAQVRKAVGSSFTASQLEVYAQCPFRYLGEFIWHEQLLTEKDDAVQPADEGTLLHNVLARFVGEHLQEKLTQQPLAALMDELELCFAEECHSMEQRGQIVSSSLWEAEQPRLWRLLQGWLRFEYVDQERWTGFTPAAVEWDFSSKNGKPLPLTLQDGSRVTLAGRLDRLDSDGERFFVTDYKRSTAPSGKDLLAGFDLQLPVYLLAVAERLGAAGRICGGSYFVLKDAKRQAKLVLENVGNADLPLPKKQAPETEGWASFADFCSQLLTGYIEAIYAGNFAVQPRRCNKYCQLQDICRIQELGAGGGAEDDE